MIFFFGLPFDMNDIDLGFSDYYQMNEIHCVSNNKKDDFQQVIYYL